MRKVYNLWIGDRIEWVIESPYGQGWQAYRNWHTGSTVHRDTSQVAGTFPEIMRLIIEYDGWLARPGEYLDTVTPSITEDVKAECLLNLMSGEP